MGRPQLQKFRKGIIEAVTSAIRKYHKDTANQIKTVFPRRLGKNPWNWEIKLIFRPAWQQDEEKFAEYNDYYFEQDPDRVADAFQKFSKNMGGLAYQRLLGLIKSELIEAGLAKLVKKPIKESKTRFKMRILK